MHDQATTTCQRAMLQHGTLRLPQLQLLSILQPVYRWHLKLLPFEKPQRVDILSRVVYLSVTPGPAAWHGTGLGIQFRTMPRLETLVVSRVYPSGFDDAGHRVGRNIKSLRVDGTCMMDWLLQKIFKSEAGLLCRRLIWWDVLSNLVTLQTTTQLLFTNRRTLPYLMEPPDAAGVYQLSKVTANLPATLRHIILTEQWGPYSKELPTPEESALGISFFEHWGRDWHPTAVEKDAKTDADHYHDFANEKRLTQVSKETYRLLIDDLVHWALRRTQTRSIQFLPNDEDLYETVMNTEFIAPDTFSGLHFCKRDRHNQTILGGFWHGFFEMPADLPWVRDDEAQQFSDTNKDMALRDL